MPNFRRIRNNWQLYLLILPVVAYYVIFHYWPMYGVQIAFKDFMAARGVWDSPWVGFEHFERFFNSLFFDRIIWNTISISLYALVIGFPLPILLALMFNEVVNKRFKKIIQNISYAPYFISQVVLVGMLFLFLSPETGFVNKLIELFGGEPVTFMQNPGMFKTIFVLSGVWQGLGWSTVIYMAVLAGVDGSLVEAAIIDGANKWQRIWYITFPTLIPISVILLILSAGGIMNVGFEKVFLMQNQLNMSTSDVIATFIYRYGLLNFEYSFAAAVGLFNSVINCTILVLVNGIARKVSDNSLW